MAPGRPKGCAAPSTRVPGPPEPAAGFRFLRCRPATTTAAAEHPRRTQKVAKRRVPWRQELCEVSDSPGRRFRPRPGLGGRTRPSGAGGGAAVLEAGRGPEGRWAGRAPLSAAGGHQSPALGLAVTQVLRLLVSGLGPELLLMRSGRSGRPSELDGGEARKQPFPLSSFDSSQVPELLLTCPQGPSEERRGRIQGPLSATAGNADSCSPHGWVGPTGLVSRGGLYTGVMTAAFALVSTDPLDFRPAHAV